MMENGQELNYNYSRRGIEMTEKEYIEKLETKTRAIAKIKETTRRNFQDMVNLLTSAVSLSSPYLGSHLRRVAETSKDLARMTMENKEDTYSVYYAGLLHDIGLLGVSEALISTPLSDLSEEEKSLYRKHPETGESIISTVYDLRRICSLIRHHHEDYNGQGYPDGLSGEGIPRGARILRVVNDYDNLLYKEGYSTAKAIEAMQEKSGIIYDPEQLERFGNLLRSSGIYSKVEKRKVLIRELQEGQFLLDDIYMGNGMLLIPQGVFLNKAKMNKISSFSSLLSLDQQVSVKG